MWQCKQHGKDCKSYVESDIIELNKDNVQPDKVKEWYIKKYPHMKHDADWYEQYVKKCLEWVEE